MKTKQALVPVRGISYLLDAGNSSEGPVGFCARITIPGQSTKADALAKFKEVFKDGFDGVPAFESESTGSVEKPGLEHVRVYFNPDCFTVDDIEADEVEVIVPEA